MTTTTTPQYFSFQGKVLLAQRSAAGQPLAATWVGDTNPLQVKLNTQTDDQTESWSGNRFQAGIMSKGTKVDLSGTFKQWSPAALAAGFYSTPLDIAQGTVTAEPIPQVIAGNYVRLANTGVSNLVITDSSATPVPVPTANYQISQSTAAANNNGVIEFLNTGTGTQPYKAAYSYSEASNLAMFNQPPKETWLILDGVDTETGDAILFELYRARFLPFSQIDLIMDGYGSLAFTGSALFDALNVGDPTFGGFGRIVRTPAVAAA